MNDVCINMYNIHGTRVTWALCYVMWAELRISHFYNVVTGTEKGFKGNAYVPNLIPMRSVVSFCSICRNYLLVGTCLSTVCCFTLKLTITYQFLIIGKGLAKKNVGAKL